MRFDFYACVFNQQMSLNKRNCDTIYHNNNDLLYSPVGNLGVQYNFSYGLKIQTSKGGGGNSQFMIFRQSDLKKKKINCIGFYSKLLYGIFVLFYLIFFWLGEGAGEVYCSIIIHNPHEQAHQGFKVPGYQVKEK